LRDVSDLFPIDRMQELARARNDVEALMDPPATDAVARRRNRARWTLLPVVTLRDPSEDAGSAQAVLSQLDAALRGE
ncbi:MAG: hypothetical protein ACO32J_03260, partial [Phycisphaerales bacterium]